MRGLDRRASLLAEFIDQGGLYDVVIGLSRAEMSKLDEYEMRMKYIPRAISWLLLREICLE